MRFPVMFKRVKPAAAGQVTLGDDADPTTAGVAGKPPAPASTNLIDCRFSNVNGWPTHRLAVVYTTDALLPITLTCDLYVWEEAIGQWFKLTAASVNLPLNQVVFIDVLTLCDQAPNKKTIAAGQASSGSVELLLVVHDPGAAAPNGNYLFAAGPDLTTA